MKVLAIETSCDDTSLAIVEERWEGIFCAAMMAASQLDIHYNYGWVVPELASRWHLRDILHVVDQLSQRAGYVSIESMMDVIDSIAVTTHPWLPGSLIIGRTCAYFLSNWFDKPCYWVNHLYGHIFSFFVDRQKIKLSNCLILSISGGHSDLSLLSKTNDSYDIKKIGTTRDDAIGEVFDKVSRMLWWPYPWGKRISDQARLYNPDAIPTFAYRLKKIILDQYDYSFSGMKSQVYNFIADYYRKYDTDILSEEFIVYIAYHFQEVVLESLLHQLYKAYDTNPVDNIAIVGGVSANLRLRSKIDERLQFRQKSQLSIPSVYFPTKFEYCTDNAAMIGSVPIVNKSLTENLLSLKY